MYNNFCVIVSDITGKYWNNLPNSNLACTQTLFYFSLQKHQRAKQARENHYPLRWRSMNPLRFIFYHPRSTVFEEKIENKGSVNRLTLTIVKHFLVHYSSSRLCISSTVTLQRIYVNRPASDIFPFLGQKALLV